jgi:hypothetical protein
MLYNDTLFYFYLGEVPLTITGYGFSSEPNVTVGGNTCEVTSSTSIQIVCLLPASVSVDKTTLLLIILLIIY